MKKNCKKLKTGKVTITIFFSEPDKIDMAGLGQLLFKNAFRVESFDICKVGDKKKAIVIFEGGYNALRMKEFLRNLKSTLLGEKIYGGATMEIIGFRK